MGLIQAHGMVIPGSPVPAQSPQKSVNNDHQISQPRGVSIISIPCKSNLSSLQHLPASRVYVFHPPRLLAAGLWAPFSPVTTTR